MNDRLVTALLRWGVVAFVLVCWWIIGRWIGDLILWLWA